MEVIKVWAISLIAAVIISAIIESVAPKGFSEKSVKILISLFLLFVMIFPFMGDGLNLNDLDKIFDMTAYNYETDGKLSENVISITQKAVEDDANNFLKESGIIGSTATAEIELNENNTLKTNSITIKSNGFIPNKVIEKMKEKYKCAVNVE